MVLFEGRISLINVAINQIWVHGVLKIQIGQVHLLFRLSDFFEKCDGDINYEDNARMQIYSGIVGRYKLQQTMDLYDIEMHVLRIGDVAFATNPYELFLNYGNQIRARSLAKQTFLSQLCCGSYGYLPTEKAEKGSHYSAFVGSGTTDHVGGEMLVRKTLQEINALFMEKA